MYFIGDHAMKLNDLHGLIGLILVLSVTTVYAEQIVIVNGQRLSFEQIQRLEQIHCGPIENGDYWLDVNSGLWGYAGNPIPQGYITDNCYQQDRHRPGLSERGLLYSPGELLR